MVNPVTQSMVDRIIETKYKGKIAELGYGKDTPLWSLIPKRGDFREETLMLRNRYGLNPSGSHTVATARSRQGASSYARFGLTQSKAYGSVAFDGMTARALVAGDTKRAIDIVSLEVESQAMHFGRRMNRMMYQNHGGSLGIRITSGGNTQTITVYAEHRERLINVHPGMYLVSSNTDGTSGSVDANPTVVSAVNYETGTITTSAAVSWDNAAGGFSNDDYLFPQGAFGAAFYGLDSWVPSTAPTGTFLGQSRAANPVLLGGVRYTASAGNPDGTILRSLSNAAIEGKKWGARPDVIMMNIDNFGALINEIEGRIEYTSALARRGGYGEKEAEVDVGIMGVRVTLPTNPGCMVVPDNDCPRNVAYMLDFRTIAFHGVGMTEPEWLDPAGHGRWHNMLSDDIDGMEALMGIYGNLGIESPGCNIRVNIAAVV